MAEEPESMLNLCKSMTPHPDPGQAPPPPRGCKAHRHPGLRRTLFIVSASTEGVRLTRSHPAVYKHANHEYFHLPRQCGLVLGGFLREIIQCATTATVFNSQGKVCSCCIPQSQNNHCQPPFRLFLGGKKRIRRNKEVFWEQGIAGIF